MPKKRVRCPVCNKLVPHSQFGLTTKTFNKKGVRRKYKFDTVDKSSFDNDTLLVQGVWRCTKCGTEYTEEQYRIVWAVRCAKEIRVFAKFVSVVGSRRFLDRAMVQAFIRALPKHCVIVSGGALHVDTWAKLEADKLGMRTIIIRPQYQNFPDTKWGATQACYARNKIIAQMGDAMMAFPDAKQKGGTDNAIEYARNMYKVVKVGYGPCSEKNPRKKGVTRKKKGPEIVVLD